MRGLTKNEELCFKSFVFLCANTYLFEQDKHKSNDNIKPGLYYSIESFSPYFTRRFAGNSPTIVQSSIHISGSSKPTLVLSSAATMSLTRPNHLSYEQHFERECEFFQETLLREADSLNRLENRRAGTIQIICDLIVQLEIVRRLAETMARKSPMCPTVLISPLGYFRGEFQSFCRAKILPGLIRSLTCLNESDIIYRDINYSVAAQLEEIHEDFTFVLDSRE